jgi:hypothetical protein
MFPIRGALYKIFVSSMTRQWHSSIPGKAPSVYEQRTSSMLQLYTMSCVRLKMTGGSCDKVRSRTQLCGVPPSGRKAIPYWVAPTFLENLYFSGNFFSDY